MSALWKRVIGSCLSMTLVLSASPGTALAFSPAPSEPAVSLLSDSELAGTFGGQTVDGVAATVDMVSDLGAGAAVAGTLNHQMTLLGGYAGMEAAGTGLWTVGGGIGLAVVTAYLTTQTIFNTIGNSIANSVYATLNAIQGDPYAGRIIGAIWTGSDLLFTSDVTVRVEVVQAFSEWYCGGVGCFCDWEFPCDEFLECQDGFCRYYMGDPV